MSLEKFIKKWFEGYSDDKLESLLEKLNDLDITSESDLQLLEEEDLCGHGFGKIEIRKLMLLKSESKNDLKSVLQEKIFVREPMAKIEKCLRILNEMGAYNGSRLFLVLEKIEMSSDFDDVDKKKLKLYINPEEKPISTIPLKCAFQVIFKGEDAAKINKYLSICKEVGIQWENHLPLGMVDLDNHPDILEIDKNKIRQYVQINYNKDFEEFQDNKKEEREMKKLELAFKCTKMEIGNHAMEGMKKERLQITDECSELRKEIAKYQKGHPVYNYFAGTDTKIKNLEQSLKQNENLKNEMDAKIDARIRDLNAIAYQ